uniref:Putative replication protein n=1 Tax=Dendrocopos leucotos CRESS-DNA-virus sp. TaxID=2815028 RepID=A0A8A4XB98_9VIRU|nr:MAG: putative replication protein [Dendrocopos leucotos CRESS-DNA-virus sp.]
MSDDEVMSESGAEKPKDFQCAAWFFTLNNPLIPAETLVQELQFLGSDGGTFQLEEGKEGTPHFQGVVTFKQRVRSSQLNRVEPGRWEKLRSRAAAKKYCNKPAGRLDGPWSWGWANPKVLLTGLEGHVLYPWQKDLIDKVCTTSPDMRSLDWVWSEEGAKGKSSVLRYLMDKHDACVVDMDTLPNMICAVAAHIEPDIVGSKGDPKPFKVLIVDCAREDRVCYKFLERVKDGYLFNTKYRAKMIRFDPVHLMVFANVPPVLDRNSLLPERVRVLKVD